MNLKKNEKNNNTSNLNDISSNVQLLSEQTFIKLNVNKNNFKKNNKHFLDNIKNVEEEIKKENDDIILSNSENNLIERFNVLSKTFTNKKIILNFENERLNNNYEGNDNIVSPIRLGRSLTKHEKNKK